MKTDNDGIKDLTIGAVARCAGVGVETIRYYERRGLLPEPPRSRAGYRMYAATDIERLCFIKEAQALGFTLEEIGDLLALRVDAERSCDDVRRRAEGKVAEIEDKLHSLQAMRAALTEMILACEREGLEGDCPFLEALERQAQQRGTTE